MTEEYNRYGLRELYTGAVRLQQGNVIKENAANNAYAARFGGMAPARPRGASSISVDVTYIRRVYSI